jgi:hypothetical protein
MKKIPSLFKRDYDSDHRLLYDEVVPGSEWVLAGEGTATIKFDGTACMVRDGVLYKRYDRKMVKSAYRRKKSDPDFKPTVEHFKPAPDGWEPCEPEPNLHTGHWPGWVPVGDEPESKWHREAWEYHAAVDGTCELVGSKVNGNPYKLDGHYFWPHGLPFFDDEPPRTFDGLKAWFTRRKIEGVVWWHPDGRMVKIRRRDFGLPWPVEDG